LVKSSQSGRMNQDVRSASAAGLSESQRAALLTLLTDDDQMVYHTVRGKILSCGPSAADWLRAHTLSGDPTLRRRAWEIVLHFDRQAADNRFLAFCLAHGEDFDLERGAWLLAQTRYPEINVEACQALLDHCASRLGERLVPGGEPRQVLETLNQCLFQEMDFAGSREGYHVPDNSYLNRILDRRTGTALGLCVVCLLVGRRLKLPMAAVGLAGHFICRYQASAGEIYFDPFHRGQLLSKADCLQYLFRANHRTVDETLAPASARRMLLGLCADLHQSYVQLEMAAEMTRLQRYLVALGR
jgi:regulator of sirC expression with transglutaminase-like and TPR domain